MGRRAIIARMTEHTTAPNHPAKSEPKTETKKEERKDPKAELLDALMVALDSVANGAPGSRVVKLNYARAALETALDASLKR